jgi:hypothetical protein
MSKNKLREQFEAWYEADSIPSESNWFKRDDQYPDEYHYLATQISWGGFQACAKIKDLEIAELNNKITGLTRQRNAYKTADDARNKLIDCKVEIGVKERTKELNSLSSERDANAILTEETEQLNAKVAMMREAVQHYKNTSYAKDIDSYDELQEALSATEAGVTKWVIGVRVEMLRTIAKDLVELADEAEELEECAR